MGIGAEKALADDEETRSRPLDPDADEQADEEDVRASDARFVAPPKPRSSAWLGYLTLTFVILLALGGFVLLQAFRSELGGELNKEDQQVIELSRQIGSLQHQLATLHTQVAGLQSQLVTEDSKIERVLGEQSSSYGERLDLAKTELTKSVENIQRQLNRSRGDVLVADAEYLLSIANQKLHLVGDVKAVLAAMEAADQRLHDSGDPGVFPIREALAEEINVLKNFSAPDIVGMSAKLLVLEGKIRTFPLFLPHAATSKEPAIQPRPPTAPLETDIPEVEKPDAIDSALESLKDLITVRHTDRPIQTILTPEEVEALRQVLLLKLEITRASLLRGDETMFHENLRAAQEFIRSNFDPEAAATGELLAELDVLMAQKIQVPLPDVSKSLSLIRNIERLRLKAEHDQKERQPKGEEPGTKP